MICCIICCKLCRNGNNQDVIYESGEDNPLGVDVTYNNYGYGGGEEIIEERTVVVEETTYTNNNNNYGYGGQPPNPYPNQGYGGGAVGYGGP